MVFEKAWAKLHGSYEATAGGQTCDALNYLCGGIVRHIHCHVDNEDEWQQLLSLQEEHNKHETTKSTTRFCRALSRALSTRHSASSVA